MSRQAAIQTDDPKTQVLALLKTGHLMTVATLRADGWPQATVVNYLSDGLWLYFLVARGGQKMANISRDDRVGIAIGTDRDGPPRGLSIAARVIEIEDPARVKALNRLNWRAPQDEQFTPHPPNHSVALLQARPTILSLVTDASSGAPARVFQVHEDRLLTEMNDHAASGD